jgi:hypothetical protein
VVHASGSLSEVVSIFSGALGLKRYTGLTHGPFKEGIPFGYLDQAELVFQISVVFETLVVPLHLLHLCRGPPAQDMLSVDVFMRGVS